MPTRRMRSAEDRARIDQIVADLGHVILDNPLPTGLSRVEIELTSGARLDVIRAANAVSAAALGSDIASIEEARAAVDTATKSVRTARSVVHRLHQHP